MPGMTEDDDHPFDPRQTPCPGLGVVADTFWRMPGVLRSTARFPSRRPARRPPDHGPHPPDAPSPGLNSPILAGLRTGRAGAAAGDRSHRQYHHPPGRSLSGVRYRRKRYVTLLQNGQPTLTTARSTTAVRTLPWWMAGWTRGCSAWEPWDARGRGWPARGTWWRW